MRLAPSPLGGIKISRNKETPLNFASWRCRGRHPATGPTEARENYGKFSRHRLRYFIRSYAFEWRRGHGPGNRGLCVAIPSCGLNRWCGIEWANVRVGAAGLHLGVDSCCLKRMPFRVLRLSTITYTISELFLSYCGVLIGGVARPSWVSTGSGLSVLRFLLLLCLVRYLMESPKAEVLGYLIPVSGLACHYTLFIVCGTLAVP